MASEKPSKKKSEESKEESLKEKVMRMSLFELADYIKYKQKLGEGVLAGVIPVFVEKTKRFIEKNFEDLANLENLEEKKAKELKTKINILKPLILSYPIADRIVSYIADNCLGDEGVKRFSDRQRELREIGALDSVGKMEMEAARNKAEKLLKIAELFFDQREFYGLKTMYDFYGDLNTYLEMDSKPYYNPFGIARVLLEFFIRKRELKKILEEKEEDAEEKIKKLEDESKIIANITRGKIYLDATRIERLLFPQKEPNSSVDLTEVLSSGILRYLKLRVFFDVYSDIQTAESIFPKELRMSIYGFYNNLSALYSNAHNSKNLSRALDQGYDSSLDSAISSYKAFDSLTVIKNRAVHLIKEGYILAEKEVSQILEGLMSRAMSVRQEDILSVRRLQSGLLLTQKDLLGTKTEISLLKRFLEQGEATKDEFLDLGFEPELPEEEKEAWEMAQGKKPIKFSEKQIEELKQKLRDAEEKEQKIIKKINYYYEKRIRELTSRYKQSTILKAMDRVKLVMFNYIQKRLSEIETSSIKSKKELLDNLSNILLLAKEKPKEDL